MLLVTAGMGDGWENSQQHSPGQPSLGHLTWPVPPCEDHDGSSPPGALDATMAHARMGRVAMGADVPQGFAACTPASRFGMPLRKGWQMPLRGLHKKGGVGRQRLWV